MTFTDEMAGAFPAGNPLPALLRQAITWLEEQGCVRTRRDGGDGSWAGLWRDDTGQQRMVHLGSGSGSLMLCVLTDTPQDLLRLLAIGYNELCWPEQFERTPQEVRDDECTDDDYPPPPCCFEATLNGH
ncbi:hypothetical protein [Pseudomonas sp. St29]|uniref:hypothetical protein n=1 Tax=Pseudomonas sp. St29 TaxID=1500687 RepID=UPI0005FC39DC|nr:hypothetical protein [Pseudomonas sp. St29]BAQ80361.1 uncharacterized protein PST29_2472 [Pseudomonas sp. St29]